MSGVIRNQKCFIVHLVNSDQDLQVRSRTGRNVYETATGRLLLAFMSSKDRDGFLQNNGLPSADTWSEAASFADLDVALAGIRSEELAITYQRRTLLVWLCPFGKTGWSWSAWVACCRKFVAQLSGSKRLYKHGVSISGSGY